MRKIARVVLLICGVVLFITIISRPIILIIARLQLKRTFVGSSVSIKTCNAVLTRYISLNGIEINRQGIYHIKVDEARVSYTLADILKRIIPEVYLKKVEVIASCPHKRILGQQKYLNLGSASIFQVQTIKLLDSALNIKSLDLNIETNLSASVNIHKQLIEQLDIKVSKFDGFGLDLEGMKITIEQLQERQLSIAKLQYNKLRLVDVKAETMLNGRDLSLNPFSVGILNGEIQGNLQLVLAKRFQYSAKLRFVNMDLNKFVNDFDLKEKFEINGNLGGDMVLEGSGSDINVLNGDFFSMGDGGVLIIKDSRFMENIASYSRQSLDIIVENFKNYHYNTGAMKMLLDKGDIVFNIVLDGQEGRRNLNIFLHDFKL